MKSIIKLIFVFLCLISGLVVSVSILPRLFGSMTDGRRTDQLIITFTKRINKEHGFTLSSIGGSVKNGIRSCGFNFHRKGKPLNKDESRRLIVFLVEDFLREVNANEKVRPYLRDYPFSELNVDLGVISYNEDGSEVLAPFYQIVSAVKGKILYFINESEDVSTCQIEEETYQEAFEIIRKEHEQGIGAPVAF